MAALNNFQREQHGVAIRMIAAACLTILMSAACLRWSAGGFTPLLDRIMVVARVDVFVLCWLAAAIGNVARLRFFSAHDIAGGGSTNASANVSCANAILQNTLEQVALAIPIHIALAMLVASSTPLILVLGTFFAIGRLLFWIGYANGARSRALGFALTFYPSIAGLFIAVAAVVRMSF